MQLWTSFVIAVGLAMDAFAVSLAIGACGLARDGRSQFRLIFHFGWFQTMMTVLGLLAGSTLARFLDGYGNWIALALLAFVGANMIRSGFSHEDHIRPNPSKGGSLVMLSVATSLDALVVGLSMAMLKTPILIPSIIIGNCRRRPFGGGSFHGGEIGGVIWQAYGDRRRAGVDRHWPISCFTQRHLTSLQFPLGAANMYNRFRFVFRRNKHVAVYQYWQYECCPGVI